MFALRRAVPTFVRQAQRVSVRSMSNLPEELKAPPSKDEEAKYSKVVKIGNKLYGIPAVHAGDMPTDLQQQTGRRFEELIFELNGEVLFNRDPIYALPDQGTKANPVLVPSGEDSRVVGYEDPAVHQVYWFKLKKDQLTYVPRLDKYFKLQPILCE